MAQYNTKKWFDLYRSRFKDRHWPLQTQATHGSGSDGDSDDDNASNNNTNENESSSDDFHDEEVPFTEEEKIYEDNNIKMFMKNIYNKSSKVFRYEDHMFETRFEVKSAGNLLLFSLLNAFDAAAYKAISELRSKYDNTEHRQLFTTIIDKQIKSGLNTGSYDLSTDPEIISSAALGLLMSYLQSNRSMTLDSSFHFKFLVLSVPHMLERQLRGIEPDLYGTGSFSNRKNNSRCIFVIPRGIKNDPELFVGKCLPLATAAAIFAADGTHKKSDFDDIRGIHYETEGKAKKAAKKLLEEAEKLCDIAGVRLNGDHTLQNFLVPVVEAKNLQVHIFGDRSNTIIRSFPQEYDPSRKQILLQETQKYSSQVHVDVIAKKSAYFKQRKAICFKCKIAFSPNYRHLCRKMKMCFSCHKPLQTADTLITKSNEKDFCNSEVAVGSERQLYTCPKCNMTCHSKSCQNGHKYACRRIWKCPICAKYMHLGGKLSTHKEAEKYHKDYCFKKNEYCRSCHTYLDTSLQHHLCPIDSGKFPKNWQTIAVMNLQLLNIGETSENQTICANFISIMWPQENSRTRYDMISFADPKLKVQTYKLDNCVQFDSDPINAVPVTANTKIKEVPDAETSLDKQFIDWLVINSIQNCTFIVNNEDSNVMKCLINFFLMNNIIFKEVVKEGKTVLIFIQKNKVRFVDFQRYRKLSEKDIFEESSVRAHFFPQSLNRECNYQMAVKKPPDIKHYVSKFDTDSEVEAKKSYLSQAGEFNFVYELALNSHKKAKSMALVVLKYMQDMIELQEVAQDHIGTETPKDRLKFISPFDSPLCSHEGLIFALYRITLPYQIYQIKNQENGIGLTASLAENQVATFLKYVYPTHDLKCSLNPQGQVKIARTYPDIIDETDKTCYYINGCLWHRHLCPQCPRVRSGKNVVNQENIRKNEEFELKLREVEALNYKTKVWYECQVKNIELHGKILKDFIDKNYAMVPPPKRLVPRKCYKGGKTESYELQWKADENEDESFFSIDRTSAYASTCLLNSFPCSTYEVGNFF